MFFCRSLYLLFQYALIPLRDHHWVSTFPRRHLRNRRPSPFPRFLRRQLPRFPCFSVFPSSTSRYRPIRSPFSTSSSAIPPSSSSSLSPFPRFHVSTLGDPQGRRESAELFPLRVASGRAVPLPRGFRPGT